MGGTRLGDRKVAPEIGRVLYGTVQVRTDTNILIGSGDIVVEKVN
ncbi:hypothetical protein OG470_06125 [Micromonospora sp. NBC_00389]